MSASTLSRVRRSRPQPQPHAPFPPPHGGGSAKPKAASPVPQPRTAWVTSDDESFLRRRRRCPDCGRKLLYSCARSLAAMPAGRRTLVLFMHFRNVRRDGTVKDGGIELYFCAGCRVEYAYGPRVGDGNYRLLRLP
jgi:hypothetical protein